MMRATFGFLPQKYDITSGDIEITPLPDFESVVEEVVNSPRVDKGWIYSPQAATRVFPANEVKERPYSRRVFALPKTHEIRHRSATDHDHIAFLAWVMSLLTGFRLTTEEAGFLDATPIKGGQLTDFTMSDDSIAAGLRLGDRFWREHRSRPEMAKRFAAAVHSMFLAQNPQLLQFEEFIYAYTALDACYAMLKVLKADQHASRLTHATRIRWMCEVLDIPLPSWAEGQHSSSIAVAALRNDALHEALFAGAPLGFAIHQPGGGANLTLQMSALCSRLLIAILGGADANYVRTPVISRQMHRLNLG